MVNISINQIKINTGDIHNNTIKIIDCIKNDTLQGVDISVFPETAISGYMCGSLWDRIDFVKDQFERIYDIQKTMIKNNHMGISIVGVVRYLSTKKNGLPKLRNSVAIISKKSIEFYDKQILASSDHHEDMKYFEPGDKTNIFNVYFERLDKWVKIGTPICEDAWYTDHNRNIPEEMVMNGAELLIIPNQSYFYYNKQNKRYNLFSTIAKEHEIDVITINSVGVGDIVKNIVIFDGGSMSFNSKGELINLSPRFTESISRFNISDNKVTQFKKPEKYKEIVDAIVFEQKEFFNLKGIKKGQVHISGGLDSAIVAYLVQKAMGKDNTVLITNPSSLNGKSFKYVEQLSENLGNSFHINPIEDIYQKLLQVHIDSFGEGLSDTGKASMQAVLRTVQGISASHQFKTGIVATGNHTEIVLGWASFHDIGSIGVHAIIGDLTKIELFELSEYINKSEGREIIPVDIFNGKFKPAAELPDANEDPIDYWVQSGICASLIRDRKSKEDLIVDFKNNLLNTDYFPKMDEVYKYNEEQWDEQLDFAISKMRFSVFKAAQGAPTVIISPRSRGFSNRETLINFY
ncbi:MAG: nitrilase-related carbon-nitrogen hydrolase [bacterium]